MRRDEEDVVEGSPCTSEEIERNNSSIIYFPSELKRLRSQNQFNPGHYPDEPKSDLHEFLIGWVEDACDFNTDESTKQVLGTIVAGSFISTSIDAVNDELSKMKSKYPCTQYAKLKSSIINEEENNPFYTSNCGHCSSCIYIQQLNVVAILMGDPISISSHFQFVMDHQQGDGIPIYYDLSTVANKFRNFTTSKPISSSIPYVIVYKVLPFYPNFPSFGYYSCDDGHQSDFVFRGISNECFSLSKSCLRKQLLRVSEVSNIMYELDSLGHQINVIHNRISSSEAKFIDVKKHMGTDLVFDTSSSLFSGLRERSLFIYILVSSNPTMSLPWREIPERSSDLKRFTHLFPLISSLHNFLALKSTLKAFRTSNYIPRDILLKIYHTNDNIIIQDFVNGFLGLIVGLLLLNYKQYLSKIGGHIWHIVNHHLSRDNILWLQVAPYGIKMNIPLSTFFGKIIHLVLDQSQLLWLYFIQRININIIFICLAVVNILLGFTVGQALIFDVIRLIVLHFYLLYRIFQALYRCECLLIFSLTNLFKGRKKNVLRGRFDTCDSDYLQLLIASILFATTVFFFTTFLVHYIFFLTMYILSQSILVIIYVSLMLVNKFPYGILLSPWLYPDRLIRSIYFSTRAFEAESHCMAPSSTFQAFSHINPDSRTLYLRSKSINLSSFIYTPMPTSFDMSVFLRMTYNVLKGERVSLSAELIKMYS